MATVDTAPVDRTTPSVPLQPTQPVPLPPTRTGLPAAQGGLPAIQGGSRPARPSSSAADLHSTTLIGSVQRAMRLLESVAAHDGGAPAKQLARETGLALPTAYHLLRTLVHEGYLRRDSGLFHLGDAAERLSRCTRRQKRRSALAATLGRWRDAIGAPMYCAIYRGGEIEIVCVADSPSRPAVDEWADFRTTGHAHAIGQCLLSQLDEAGRLDHLARYPVQPLTRYTVRDEAALLRRLDRMRRMEPVIERQEYALGAVCAAVPITVGTTAATVAFSLPVRQVSRLVPAAHQLQGEIGGLPGALTLSISI